MEGFGVSCAVRFVGLYEISARAGKKADKLRQRLGVVPCYIIPQATHHHHCTLCAYYAAVGENRSPFSATILINFNC